jgi:hypothetical protein
VVEVLAGSTCPVVDLADRTAPAAGMGWASRTGWAAVGCSNLELATGHHATGHHRKPVEAAGGHPDIAAEDRPGSMLVKVVCAASYGYDAVAQYAV